jgi:hypothetical protein
MLKTILHSLNSIINPYVLYCIAMLTLRSKYDDRETMADSLNIIILRQFNVFTIESSIKELPCITLFFLKFSACVNIPLYTSYRVTGGYLNWANNMMRSSFSLALMSSRWLQSVYFAFHDFDIFFCCANKEKPPT